MKGRRPKSWDNFLQILRSEHPEAKEVFPGVWKIKCPMSDCDGEIWVRDGGDRVRLFHTPNGRELI